MKTYIIETPELLTDNKRARLIREVAEVFDVAISRVLILDCGKTLKVIDTTFLVPALRSQYDAAERDE